MVVACDDLLVKPTVLIVGDHSGFRSPARALLEAEGFEVAERLARTGDPPAVVLVSTRGVASYRRRLAGSPVRGFLSKCELSGDALAALVW